MLRLLKLAYNRKNLLFLAVNIFCFVIIFFILNKETGGSYLVRIGAFVISVLIGGFFGAIWSVKRQKSTEDWFRMGAGTMLMMFTLLAWANNKGGYIEIDCSGDISSYSDGFSHGRIVSHAYDAKSTSCKDWISGMAKEGIALEESDCFCKGYYDGRDGRMNKYK